MEPLEIYDSINNKHINIYVTSEVAEKCRTDSDFAQDLFNKLQDQNIEDGSAVEIETIKCEVHDEPLEERNDKETWGRRDTLNLIKAYQMHKDKFEEYTQRKVVWTIIANELAQNNIFKSADKCAEKWKNLLRTYKNASEKPSTPTRFQYYKEMQNIFNNADILISDTDLDEEQPKIKYDPDWKTQTSSPAEESVEKESWSKYETLRLLKAFQKHRGIRHNFAKEKQFWTLISAELAKDNIQKLPEKCATKWKNLFRSYKRNIDKPTLPSRFQYFQEVNDVLNNVELQIPDDIISDEMDFEKILDPEQFKCFLEKTEYDSKPKDIVTWTADETLKLIKAYKKHKHRFRKCPTRKYVWAIISSEIAKEGINRDVEKCENKWKSLMRSYRRGTESGEFPRFYFYEEIAEALNDNVLNEGEVSTTQNDISVRNENADSLDDDPGNMDVSENEGNDDGENTAYEEIIIQTEPDKTNEVEDNKYWSYNETSALLKSYAAHKNDFKDLKKKGQIWEEISRELASQNFEKSSETCEKKWRSMFSVYKTHKMNKTGPGKFNFYKEMDDIFKDKAEETEEVEEDVIHNKKCKCIEKRMLEKQQRHIERMQLLKRKLDLEERKVEAFEFYVKHLKNKSS